jgi:hypothetical protein
MRFTIRFWNSSESLICYLFILPKSRTIPSNGPPPDCPISPLISVEYYNILLNADILSLQQTYQCLLLDVNVACVVEKKQNII